MTVMHYCLIGAILVTATFFAFLFTPKANDIAYRIGAVDIPKDDRRMHTNTIARLGGIAIVGAFIISVIFFAMFSPFLSMSPTIIAMLSGGGIIAILGVVDDKCNLRARFKFLIQIAAVSLPIYFGVRIDLSSAFQGIIVNSVMENVLSVVITFLWILGITNAMNFIDGLDGLASGISVISTVTITIIMVLVNNIEMALLAAALTGACLGFLPFNKAPAIIFMGDTGSTFLGYMLACISILGLYNSNLVISLAVPFFVVAVPLFDTTYAIIRRLSEGRSPMMADRLHIHHRLVDYGLSHRQAVFTLYVVTVAFSVSAIVLTAFNSDISIKIIIGIFVFMLLLLWLITSSKYIKKVLRLNRIKAKGKK
ncbi:MAG: MraY family glycosyltransferase [Clostridia bacterium]